MTSKKSLYFLKQSSKQAPFRSCDEGACEEEGCYRAPKTQDLTEYYWFCLTHVRHYNSKWNYYQGMSDEQFEKSRREDLTWNRPTWPLGKESSIKSMWKGHSSVLFGFRPAAAPALSPDILEALNIFGLKTPLTPVELKARYNFLVKKYHPDAQLLNKQGEEKLKRINQAYSVLKKFLRPSPSVVE